jgi:DNA processing protein
MPIAPEHRAAVSARLHLTLTTGVGAVTVADLVEHFGDAETLLDVDRRALAAAVGPRIADALRRSDPDRQRRIREALDWADASPRHHLLVPEDPDYPDLLRPLRDPPALLYVVGARDAPSRPGIAVVGSRNPTAAGRATARDFAFALSDAGWTIASGLALGIDGAAHEAALAGRAGTVAVLGTGVDVIYPGRHQGLAERIAGHGAVISELPLGTGPLPGLFPRRNRVIAGLARAVLVVEAALHSGSLITARQAGEYGRDVFAVPGSIHSPLARGCHALIRDGAGLAESAADLLRELGEPGAPRPGRAVRVPFGEPDPSRPRAPDRCQPDADAPTEPGEDDPVLAAIGHEPVWPDALAEHLGWDVGALAARLVVLEIEGRLLRQPDGRVVRPPSVGRLATASIRLL